MPGMDITRPFYSLTAVAGTVWTGASISISKPTYEMEAPVKEVEATAVPQLSCILWNNSCYLTCVFLESKVLRQLLFQLLQDSCAWKQMQGRNLYYKVVMLGTR